MKNSFGFPVLTSFIFSTGLKYEADYDCKAKIKVKNFFLSFLIAVMPFSTGSKSFLLFPLRRG
jgi:hypothetical protein